MTLAGGAEQTAREKEVDHEQPLTGQHFPGRQAAAARKPLHGPHFAVKQGAAASLAAHAGQKATQKDVNTEQPIPAQQLADMQASAADAKKKETRGQRQTRPRRPGKWGTRKQQGKGQWLQGHPVGQQLQGHQVKGLRSISQDPLLESWLHCGSPSMPTGMVMRGMLTGGNTPRGSFCPRRSIWLAGAGLLRHK